MQRVKTYATLDARNAMDFRSISKHMVDHGYKMGPSRVRLIMISALEKIVKGIVVRHGDGAISDDIVHEVATSPEFQNVIAPFIVQALKAEAGEDEVECSPSMIE